ISINDGKAGITICNRGLPEYEAIQEENGNVTIAITLLRCIGWLALSYMITREKEPAGPDFAAPEAQCLGNHTFHLSITTHNQDFLSSKSYKIAQEFNIPLKTFNPEVMRTALRVPDHIFFKGLPLLLPPDYFGPKFLPEKASFVRIEPNYLILSACKKAEEDSALIIRLYNSSQSPTKGTLKLHQAIQDVKIVNLDEQEVNDAQITDIQIKNNQFTFQIIGAKIATFKIFIVRNPSNVR
ncbi:MAG: hypothetical protein HWN66_12275, partial [Candidatus Helarchaeota archaeon]|nr:hypothetical protein [Candidatus Helarchaeota archaeon]